MTDHAVISGTFADLKLIKTRSTVQIIIEAPIEHAQQITNVLGFPIPGKEVPVAIARLNVGAIEPKGKKGSLAQQAGILCGEPIFLKFLAENYQHIGAPKDNFEAAAVIRQICGVNSRAEFDSDPAAGQRWRAVKGKYDAWKTL